MCSRFSPATSSVCPSSSTFLITGAAGMIGSGLVRYLNDLGFTRLILVDDLKRSEKWKNLVGKQFINLISKHQLFTYLQSQGSEISAVFHLGACSDTTELDADYLLENNYRYTIRLAEWALIHQKRFIYASTAATYGDGAQGFDDAEEKIEELRPLNMYGYSKHLVDLWMKSQGVLNQVVGLKYFNVFGPNEYHKAHMASMVLKMAEKADQEGIIRLYQSNDLANFADGEQCRDFIYVKDAVKMTAKFIEKPFQKVHGLFNIGHGKTATWNQLAKALFAALKKEPRIEYIPMPPLLSRQYQNYTCAKMEKYRNLMGSFPFTSLEKAVEEYVTEYLMRQKRW